ncbi:hypothetical protein C2845_PM02G15600 [Panicum miliaceum]|uniref:hAT-like transposase RNase-H fold domain-containing protein n=1 Tax=Panicum miliaceum TaxID=4540 RepID=A0A3L6SAB8_PANMI|nr:hypothetical protein C2845_PM02G15600 [Panicum miliaceum]
MKMRSNVFHLLAGFPLDYQIIWNDFVAAFEERKLVLQEVLKSADCNETMVHMLKQDLVLKKVLPVEGKLLHNQCASHIINLQDTKYTHAPSFEEWERLGVVYRLLDVCYDATTEISCSSCPTSNLYFHEIWKIKLTLDGEASEVDNDVQKMIKGMKRKFKKYWKKSYISLSVSIIFDPWFKYMFVEFRFKKAFGADAGKSLRRVQKVLRELYDEYSSQNDCNVDCTEMSMEDNGPFTDWCQHLSSNVEVSTELDRYLNERPIDLS